MEEREYIISLFEYYKGLLTDKQKEYFEDYYYENLTMEEIASNDDVSKNAVSKQLIGIKDKLYYYENILELKNKSEFIKKNVDEKTLDIIINYI